MHLGGVKRLFRGGRVFHALLHQQPSKSGPVLFGFFDVCNLQPGQGGDVVVQNDQRRRILEADCASMFVKFGLGPFETQFGFELPEGLVHKTFEF
jgi:hypothetical protein